MSSDSNAIDMNKEPSSLSENNKIQKYMLVQKNTQIVEDLLGISRAHSNWSPLNLTTPYLLVELEKSSQEYEDIRSVIYDMEWRGNFTVHKIKRIENPFLLAQYHLKKLQKQARYPDLEDDSVFYFHGTRPKNIKSICMTNFDWRRMTTHLYGHGVSFSPESKFASYYPYPRNDFQQEIFRVMILVKVLVGKRVNGDSRMIIPIEPYDTSVKPGDENVIVKYEDNEYYPEYYIYYSSKKF